MCWTADRHVRGFTLLEMMVALALISVVMLGVFRLQGQTLAMARAERFYTLAPLLAQERLSMLLTADAGDLYEASGNFGDAYPGYAWQVRLGSAGPELLESVGDRLRRLEVAVSLNQSEYTYTLVTCHLYD